MRRKGSISKKCMVCIMSAMMMMSSVTGTMIAPIGAYAADYDTTADVPEDENHNKNLASGDTLTTNTGTIHENNGTIENNYGTVVNSDSGKVETNHTGGTVTGGDVEENYGKAINADVKNNYSSGTVTGSDSRIEDNFGTADGIGGVTNNYGTVVNSDVANNYSSGTVKKHGEGEASVEKNFGGTLGEGVSLSDEEGYGEQPASPGPNAAILTQTDPQPTALVPASENPGSNDNLDYAPPSGSDNDLDDFTIPNPIPPNPDDYWRKYRDRIVNEPGTAYWNGTEIVFTDGIVLTVIDLAGVDCLAVTSTVATQTELQAVYASIFKRTIASNGGSVVDAREEALRVTETLADCVAKDTPTNYSPERAAQYKEAYIEAFLKYFTEGNPLSGAQEYAKTAVNNLKNELDMQQRIEDLDEINPSKLWQRVFIALTDDGMSQKEALKVAEGVLNVIPSGYTEDMTDVYFQKFISSYEKAIESGKGLSAARKAAQKAARQAVNVYIFALANQQYNSNPAPSQTTGYEVENRKPDQSQALAYVTAQAAAQAAAQPGQPQTAINAEIAPADAATAQNVAAPALASVIAPVDPASMGEADYTEKMVSMISVAPYGGTIELDTNDSAYLNELIISSLETRTDVALRMKVTVNAVPYVISIPAGHNLRALEDENRKIDMQKLIDTFANAR